MAADRALVLGGGGLAGAAWMTGLLHGLAETGQDVTSVLRKGTPAQNLVIGTSAGASVAAQLGSGLPLSELYARQVDPALQSREIPAELNDLGAFAQQADKIAAAATPEEKLRMAGEFALAAKTVSEDRRREVIAGRLPSHEWPTAWTLKITAVNCEDGEFRVFDSSSGVHLVDAVAASCAVPGVWPPTPIDGKWFMDGGVRSMDNADLAAGCHNVLVVSPFGVNSQVPAPFPLADAVSQLQADGSVVRVISPDEASLAAFGANPLDPATRGPAAEAGYAQGHNGL